ncbi:hypothetical protein HGRIS_009001 [Hohenbuehelia grisea]|uniref:Carboxylic ester hydrolase n=1 Tax=Hohenbuehelia grisea TaxID=104357 RepID=A0ABR3J086_9AGAR
MFSVSHIFQFTASFFEVVSLNRVGGSTPFVTLDYGTFLGAQDGNLTSFLGIPFADSPVGDLRFRLPVPPPQLEGVQRAVSFGAACPQHALSPLPGMNFTGKYTKVSEDCLAINIIRPSFKLVPGRNLPVLVYFHGGGFEIGDATETRMNDIIDRSVHSGEPLMVVVPNYRLNGLGFLAGKEVKEAGVSNLGLQDQRFALQWVQKYISSFGGDPDRVTISGVSAGAVSVAMHLVSLDGNPNGLFHSAFMLSGGPLRLPSVLDGQSEYDLIVSETNCSAERDTLSCLRRVPLDQIMAAINKTRDIFSYSSLNLAWQPRVDGDLLRREPYESLVQGLYAKVPSIAGTCDDEGTLFSLANLNITTDEAFSEYISSNYLKGTTSAEISDVLRAYPRDPTKG